MALFKIAKGSASNLSTSTISKKPVEGYCWFTTDDGRFYIDTSTSTNNAVIGTNRIAINGVHTASNSWTAGSSAGPTLSITINDITSTAAAIPSASATASGIVTTGNQTFAGRKTMDLISPSVYDGTGDTSRYRRIYFKNNSGTAVGNIRYDSGNATNVTAGQFTFFEYSPKETPDTGNNGHTEAYSLPNVTSGLTTDKSYKIITTKNPEDLGYYLPLSGGTMTGTVKLVSGSSVYAEGNPMFYWLSGSTSSYQKQAAIFTTASTVNSKKVCDRMYFREYSYNSTTGAAIEYWDQYRLPVVTADKTSSDSYEILTSKSAVTIAQGGTSATTAGAAANNLLLGLPTWTANPNDDTYFIRRDTAGGDAFGQVKASTIYNYIAGKTTVSNTWTAGTTAGPTIKTTVNGVAGTAVAIPSASKTASGIVTTGDQYFNGTKGFGYMARYGRTNTGAATRWVADTWLYNDAGTQVGEFWYDCGDATNITTGQYVWSQYSPNSTANTSTTGKKENYKLPVVTSGLTETKNYTIITTKNPADLGYYLPLSGGQMTGAIGFGATSMNRAILYYNSTYPKYGIWYNDASVDTMRFSASGNADTNAGADLCINGNGDGTVTIRGATILTTSNYSTTCDGRYVKKAGDTMTGHLTAPSTACSWISGQNAANAAFNVGNATNTDSYWPWMRQTNTSSAKWFSFGTLGTSFYWIGSATSRTGNGYDYGMQFNVANGYLQGCSRVYGAVWNDYAEYRKDNPNETQKPGHCVRELGNGVLALTTKRLERGCEIVSDTFGFAIGQDEENGYNTPIASNGRVLAYIYEGREYASTHIGWPVCSGPNGTVSIMTDEEYQKYGYCAIGTISEIPDYEEWGTGKIKVDGRIWIRIR